MVLSDADVGLIACLMFLIVGMVIWYLVAVAKD